MVFSKILNALAGRNSEKRAPKKQSKRRSLAVEALEERHMLAAWIPQGPNGITGGQVENVGANDQVVGTVHSFAAHPLNANTAYVGTVNGGIWRSDNATISTPTWVPQTDFAPTLSIGSIDFDPTDPTGNTLVAGTGNFSATAIVNGPQTGIYRTTDGGTNWASIGTTTLGGLNITGSAPRGDVLVVATSGGIFRSDDAGLTFISVQGGNTTDLISAPGNQDVMYAAVATVGVLRTDDAGLTWTNINDATLTAGLAGGNDNIKISMASTGRIYVGASSAGQLAFVGYTDNPNPQVMGETTTWTAMDLPETEETDSSVDPAVLTVEGIHPNMTSVFNFDIVADPTNPNVVYVGGDRQPMPLTNFIGAQEFTGRLFRGDASIAPNGPPADPMDPFVLSPQWEHLTHSNSIAEIPDGGTSNNSAPFAGTHQLTFSGGSLIATTDGGIYKRTSPSTNTGTWLSMIGNLQVTQVLDLVYDANSNVLVSANQDTGVSEQISSGGTSWRTAPNSLGPRGRHVGLTGDIAIDDNSTPGMSYRYSGVTDDMGMIQFIRREVNSANVQISETVLLAIPDPTLISPIGINEVDGSRIVIGGTGMLHESFDRGDTNAPVNGAGGVQVDAIKYGHVTNPNLLVFAQGATLMVRTGDPLDVNDPTNMAVATAAAPGVGTITDIAWDLADANIMYVTGTTGVAETLDGGATWTNVTGNLAAFTANSIEYVTGAPFNGLVVGTNMGVHYSNAGDFTVWNPAGSDFPNVNVQELDYHGNTIYAGTYGRGVWSLPNAGAEVNVVPPPPVFDYGDAPDSTAGTGIDDYTTIAANLGPSHPVMGPRLGRTVDGEPDGLQSIGARGDDLGNSDDEDGVTFSAMIEGQAATVTVQVTNAPGFVTGWIDFDQNGDFAAGEQIVADQAFIPGTTVNIPFTVPAGMTGQTYARFRVQSVVGLGPNGPAIDGEVEDYQVNISAIPLDYGDAPDPSLGTGTGNYATTAADGGPSHNAVGPRLGTRVDGESDALPTGIANGDDANDTDDEDGVFFSNIRAGLNATATVLVTQADGQVDGWIDWNRNGDFTDLGEQIITNQTVLAGTSIPFTFAVPAGLGSQPTYARFRVSSAGGLGPTGAAADGEVEDYHIALQSLDFGDAPDTTTGTGIGDYDTLFANSGPAHIVGGPVLGLGIDEESDGQPTVAADGDDLNGLDDEDGVIFGTLTTSSIGDARVLVSGLDGYVDAWIDFDQDGTFDADEKIVNAGLVPVRNTRTFQFFIPATAIAGTTYARFRVSPEGGIGPTGLVAGGEVEDFQVTISQGPIVDYGDAPDPTFRTTIANNGAAHVITSNGPILGTTVDGETNGQPNATATGDDADGNDDEDGVSFIGSILPGGNATVQITVSQANGRLDGWVDFNQNNRFDEPAERIFNNVAVNASSGVLVATNRDGEQNELVVINAGTGAVVNTITAPQTVGVLNGIAFDGNHIWYIEGIGGTEDILYQIDLSGGVVSSTNLSVDPAINGNHTFDGLAALNGLIYVQDTTATRIHVFDPATRSITASLNPGIAMEGGLAALRDPVGTNHALFASNKNNKTIIEINPANGQVVRSFTHNLPSHTGTAVVNGLLYLANLGDSTVTVVNRLGVVQGTLNVTPGASTTSVSLRSLAGGQINSGPNTQLMSFAVPGNAVIGNTYARFRVSSLGGLSPVGQAADGEVEDHEVTVGDIDGIGVFRNGRFFLDVTKNGEWDGTAGGDALYQFGGAGDVPISGDWNGDGKTEIGVFRTATATFYKDSNGNGRFDAGDEVRQYGAPGDVPVIGNWNGDLIDDIAVFRPSQSTWFKDANANGVFDGPTGGDQQVTFGGAGDIPIAGRWAGGNIDRIGIYRQSQGIFYLDGNGNDSFDGAGLDFVFPFGAPGDIPIVGNWNGNASDNIGVYRPSNSFVFRDVTGDGTFGAGDLTNRFGGAGDIPVAGDWATPPPLLASTIVEQSEAATLNSAELNDVADAAFELLVGVGIDEAKLRQINFQIADLNGARLGEAMGNTITIDVNAAGHGWFVDQTPEDNDEFTIFGRSGLLAEVGSAPADQIDLLTVMLHEIGHSLGLDDDSSSAHSSDLMNSTLSIGTRRLPTEGELAAMMLES